MYCELVISPCDVGLLMMMYSLCQELSSNEDVGGLLFFILFYFYLFIYILIFILLSKVSAR